jgi:hypothetical protein
VKYPWLTPFIAPTIKIPWPGGRRLYDVAIEPMYQKGFRLYRRIRNWLRRRSIRSGGAGNS